METIKNNLLLAAASGDHIFLKNQLESLPKFTRKINKLCRYDLRFVEDENGSNLLQLAISSKSFPCIKIITKFINCSSSCKDNPLTLAIRNDCSMEIVQFLIEYEPEFLQEWNMSQEWAVHVAIQKGNLPLVKFLIDEGHKYFRNRYLNYEEFLHKIILNSLNNFEMLKYFFKIMPIAQVIESKPFYYYLEIRENIVIPLEVLNLFLSSVYNKKNGYLIDNLIHGMAVILCNQRINEEYKKFIINNVYLNDTNKFQPLVKELMNSGAYDIMFYLHSKLRGKMSKMITDYVGFEFRLTYLHMFETFHTYSDSFFKELIQAINSLWCDNDNEFVRIQSINFLYFISSDGIYTKHNFYERLAKFFDLIEANKFNTKLFFAVCESKYELSLAIPTLLPFIAVPCGDDLISEYFSNETKRKHIFESKIPDCELPAPFTEYCSQADQRNPMKLTSICRTTIRRSVFNANGNSSNGEKLEKLKSLMLPRQLINYLLFNYTSYDMSEKKMQ